MQTNILQNNPHIFIHIPKTAGTTFHFILSREYRSVPSFWMPDNNNGSGEKILATLPEQKLVQLRLLRGHMYFGLHKFLCSERPVYFTFVREPVTRIISYYYHMRHEAKVHNDKTGWWYETARMRLPIKNYVEEIGDPWVDNDMVRRISGINFQFGTCNNEYLEIAKQNIDKYFVFIGLTENFDESICAFKYFLNWHTNPFYSIEKQNPCDQKLVQLIKIHLHPLRIKIDLIDNFMNMLLLFTRSEFRNWGLLFRIESSHFRNSTERSQKFFLTCEVHGGF